MTSLGAGISDREPITIFNNPPTSKSLEEYNYREAARLADEAWYKQRDNVDEVLDHALADRNYVPDWAHNNLLTAQAIEADKRKHDLWLCWQLNHPQAVEVGHTWFDGEPQDDYHLECPVCGMVVHYIHGSDEPTEEIPI